MKKLTTFLALFTFLFPANNLLRAQCATPTAQADLDIANIRATILNGGDMWWNAMASIGPKYEVPKGSGKHSLFAGALWMGGIDASNNLHVAVQTYRQNGVDFWPGPLDTTSASVSPATCLQYDHLWKINRQDVISFIAGGPATSDMLTYPGNGTGTQAHFLAPFYDSNGDGIYNTTDGDYPDFGFSSNSCCDVLHGDQALWWVINDVGDVHGSGGSQFGFEIRCQAFAFNNNDPDINNTTFYQYDIINRSSNIYNDSYLGLFVDGDLGNYLDDYIGSDVPRNMGYCYNGDADDEGVTGYGLHPPAVGIDFLQGPLTDSCGIVMQNFIYFNNDFTPQGNPTTATNYYNYLRPFWINGTPLTYGGSGYLSGGPICTYAFPGSSDHLYEYGTGGNCLTPAPAQPDWDEFTAGNVPNDRRFLMSSGPFTIAPGAVLNCITFAAVWARNLNDPGPHYSLSALQAADDKAQLFFDNCFDINVLGINKPQNIEANIFPNPVSDMLEVQLRNIVADGNFTVYDVTGKMVKQVHIKQQQKFSVSCKDLSSGIYVYRILLADGKTSGGKFVKK